ncbi:hypothetical protein HGRIS_009269 [Hohenbuehelia grisea]|uniref:DUF6741 domain-containing protein n=1 Tax=Hohenbuehelia grisea TaxID=104357 RepID=A0ABR3J0W4_9AGAR
MAYAPYDNFSRQISRRGSMSYSQAPSNYGYGEQYGNYGEPMMMDYPQQQFSNYGPPTSAMSMPHMLPGTPYDDLDMQDAYYDDGRMPVTPVVPGAMAPVLHPTMSRSMSRSMSGMPRRRRHSTVSFAHTAVTRPPLDGYRRGSSMHIKFKRKGAFSAGILLSEAQSHPRLSNNDSYSVHEFHPDYRGRIYLKVKWAGYQSMTYEIPLDNYGGGRVSLSTLARRVSRACVHYLQANIIPISWERIELHHLEEISYGTWQPMLAAR